MSLIDVIIQVLDHPLVESAMPLARQWVANQTTEQKQALQRQYLDHIQSLYASSGLTVAVAPAMAVPSQGSDATVLGAVRDRLVQVSAIYKEALRFAREDGMGHPEVVQRVGDAATILAETERFWLTPDRVQTASASEQAILTAFVADFRRMRQYALNQMTSVEDLERVAADAGVLATALQTATVTGTWTAPTLQTAQAVTATPTYSAYAPEMSLDAGCLPCGRAHIAASYAALKAAAQRAQTVGMADAQVQQRLTMVQEELDALMLYDWTPEKIARSPADEQRVLQQVAPQTEALRRQVKTAQSPQDLVAAATQAGQIWEQIKEATG